MKKILPRLSGAKLSADRKHRFYLYRIWNKELPYIKYIGLNPSTANEKNDDATIRRLIKFSDQFGFGGFYMFNLFTIVSPDPVVLHKHVDDFNYNLDTIFEFGRGMEVVFCWGNFETYGRDKELIKLFPGAKTFGLNKNGSPKHPLYLKSDTKLIDFNSKQ